MCRELKERAAESKRIDKVSARLKKVYIIMSTISRLPCFDLIRSKQINATDLNSCFPPKMEKKVLLRWDSNPQHTAYNAAALPTELLRQLSWLGQIKAMQDKGNQSNPI